MASSEVRTQKDHHCTHEQNYAGATLWIWRSAAPRVGRTRSARCSRGAALCGSCPTCRRSVPCGKRGAWSLRSRTEMCTATVALRRGCPASVASTRSSWCARSSRSSATEFMISPGGQGKGGEMQLGVYCMLALSVCNYAFNLM